MDDKKQYGINQTKKTNKMGIILGSLLAIVILIGVVAAYRLLDNSNEADTSEQRQPLGRDPLEVKEEVKDALRQRVEEGSSEPIDISL